MDLTTTEINKLTNSVYYKQYLALQVDYNLTTEQLIGIDDFVNRLGGYKSVKNAIRAKQVVDMIVAGQRGELRLVE